jgi:secondary thiamine-phosphate synthase enzyme
MQQHQSSLDIATQGQGLYEITDRVVQSLDVSGITTGAVTLFCRHTSCSLLINENADPDVRHDLEAFMKRLVPDGDPAFIHTLEGPDDMAAHIKTALTATSLTIPIQNGRVVLGSWQGIYLFEHRSAAHERHVFIHIAGA